MIDNLLKQRELLNEQISDLKTAEVRETIAELDENYKNLRQKLEDARNFKKTSDAEISAKIAEHRAEIEALNNVSFGNIYNVSSIETEMQANGAKLSEQKNILAELLAVE
jgi:molybdopterin converting factor small subunit